MTINLNYLKTRVVRYPLLVFTSALALLVTGLNSKLSTSDFSSWVQALGSIAALGIAIFVMSRQNRNAIRIVINTDRRALLRRGDAVSVLIFNAHQSIDIACHEMISWLVNGMPPDEITKQLQVVGKATIEARTILAAVPLHELGSRDMVSGTLMMLEAMSGLCASIEAWRLDGLQRFLNDQGRRDAMFFKEQAKIAMEQYDSGLNALESADF